MYVNADSLSRPSLVAGLDTGYPEWRCSWLSIVPPDRTWNSITIRKGARPSRSSLSFTHDPAIWDCTVWLLRASWNYTRKRNLLTLNVLSAASGCSGFVTHRFTLSRPFLCWKLSMRFHFLAIRKQKFATRLACHLKCQGSRSAVGKSARTAR